MIELIYSPTWFYGKDIAIDIVSIVVLFLIGFFSIRYYNIKKNRNYLFLAISFFMISLSFLFKILTNFTIYYTQSETQHLPFGVFTYQIVKSTDILFLVGFMAHMILTLLGLYLLYSIYQKNQPKTNMIFIVYLILISILFGDNTYYLFHISAFLLLLFITINYFRNASKSQHYTAKLTSYSFAIIAASNLLFVFTKITSIMYVVAEVVQLLGYALLLIAFVMVLIYGKKKIKG